MAVVGIVAAAGSGERLGSNLPKAFIACAGRPLLDWSVEVLEAVCETVVIAVPPGFEPGAGAGETSRPDPPSRRRVTGGATRSESVRAALAAAPEATVVVVQDAARPLVTAALVERCLGRIEEGFDGAIAAAPVTDTIKRAAPDGRVEETLAREALWAIQTPQVFRADILRRALDVDPQVLARATDDAWLVERAGGSVGVVEAPPENIKVTRPVDLRLAELLLEAAGSGPARTGSAAAPSG